MTSELSATCYFLVVQPMRFPIVAAPREVLAVWNLPLNLWVMDPAGEWILRRTSFPEGKLWSVLDQLMHSGVIQYLDDDERLRHPLPTADVPSRPALRVIRAG